IVTDEALDTLVERFANTDGIRDLEQAAEHMVANALYQIEVDHVSQVVFDSRMVLELLA
ncbi:MAG: ATP-dependent Lon protease, partial [Eubacterium sp.]|nr:ATP-dependent Lon protease [Eubacterium sp.]